MKQGLWILLPLGSFALAVLLHGLVMRLPSRIDSVRRFLLVGFPVGLVLVVASLGMLGLTTAGFAAVLLYALLCELYMFFFTLVISSVSVTMLIMLRQGSIEASKLVSTYDPDEMVQLRVGRLIKTGFVQLDEGLPIVTEKGLKLHRMFTGLRRFFGHEQG